MTISVSDLEVEASSAQSLTLVWVLFLYSFHNRYPTSIKIPVVPVIEFHVPATTHERFSLTGSARTSPVFSSCILENRSTNLSKFWGALGTSPLAPGTSGISSMAAAAAETFKTPFRICSDHNVYHVVIPLTTLIPLAIKATTFDNIKNSSAVSNSHMGSGLAVMGYIGLPCLVFRVEPLSSIEYS